jgi:hypothetical protein
VRAPKDPTFPFARIMEITSSYGVVKGVKIPMRGEWQVSIFAHSPAVLDEIGRKFNDAISMEAPKLIVNGVPIQYSNSGPLTIGDDGMSDASEHDGDPALHGIVPITILGTRILKR